MEKSKATLGERIDAITGDDKTAIVTIIRVNRKWLVRVFGEASCRTARGDSLQEAFHKFESGEFSNE
jgi:hypothetical protein